MFFGFVRVGCVVIRILGRSEYPGYPGENIRHAPFAPDYLCIRISGEALVALKSASIVSTAFRVVTAWAPRQFFTPRPAI